MTPTIGKVGLYDLKVDVERLISTRMLLQANSGAGKSWAVRRLLEQTYGAVQQIVLDIEGEFFTLREKLDYILAGRDGGDCPAEVRGAALLARKLLELRVSAIVDLSELKAHERFEFVRKFLEALLSAPRNLWHPVLVVVDEAHQFCPEKGKAASTAAVIDLMSRGRKRGLCGVLATQRLSKLHKDAAAEANNKLIGRSALDVDMKRAAEELGFTGREEQRGLRTLKPGEFYAFGPALCEKVELVKVGPVETTHPKAGSSTATVVAPRAAVQKVLAALADLPKQADDEARSLEESQRRVRELERQLRSATAAGADPEALTRAREQGRTEGSKASAQVLARVVGSAEAGRRRAAAALDQALEAIKRAGDALREPIEIPEISVSGRAVEKNACSPRRVLNQGAATPGSLGVPATSQSRSVRHQANAARTAHGNLSEGIDGPMQRILDALAWLAAAGLEAPFTREQVAFLASYKPGTGAFQNALGKLRSADLVTYPSTGSVAPTDLGRSLANRIEAPTTLEDLQARVLEKLDGPMRRCLEPLLAAYPEPMPREQLAESAGYQAGTGAFQNALGKLRTLGCIDYPDRGHAIACGWLFLN